ncbi:MAG: DUF2288 family protein [Polyangiales bacterium]
MDSTGGAAQLRAKLEERLGPVVFSDLEAHLARDAVFVVASSIELVECGIAVATDDVAKVEAWIASGTLRKPSKVEREAWPRHEGRTWHAIVVQPFVLIQDPPS